MTLYNSNEITQASEWSPSEWSETDTQMMIPLGEEEMMLSSSVQAAGKVLEQWLSDGQQESYPRYQSNHCMSRPPTVTPCDSSASSIENDDSSADLTSLMEVDEEIGENLLGDDVFGGPCCAIEDDHMHLTYALSDSSMENLALTAMNSLSTLGMVDNMSEEDRRFLAPLLEDTATTTMDYDAGFVVTDDESSLPRPSSPSPILNQARYQDIMKKLETSMKRSQETRKSLTMKTSKTEKYSRINCVTGVLSSIETSSRQLQTFLQTVQQMKQRRPV